MDDPKVLRILFVFDNLELSGADKVAINLIRAAVRNPSHRIAARGFVCMADQTGGACATDLVTFGNSDITAATPIWKKLFLGMRAIRRCAAAARTADILVGVTPPAAFVAKCAAWFQRKPAVAWAHYDIDAWQRELGQYSRSLPARFVEVLFYRWIVPHFANIVFVSGASLAAMGRTRGGSGSHWTVIPNLFAADGFAVHCPDLAGLAELKAAGVPILMLLGRLSRQKRWQDAIRIMEILPAQEPAPHLVVIGDGVERQQFLDRLAASPARSRIHWLGQIANPLWALSLADALILTSLYEAWPVVILEAFHCMVPVVSYACPSGPALMLSEGRGISCAETPQAMASAITDLFAMSVEQRTTMICAASRFLEQHGAEVVMPLWKAYAEELVEHR